MEIVMNDSEQALTSPCMNPVSNQCAAYLNNRDHKALRILGGIIAAGLAATAFFLYHAVLNTSTVGAAPF